VKMLIHAPRSSGDRFSQPSESTDLSRRLFNLAIPLLVVTVLLLGSSIACRLEVGLGNASAANAAGSPIMPNGETTAPAEPNPALSDPASTTPAAIITKIAATPLPTPMPPASSPPNQIIIPAINLKAGIKPVDWTAQTRPDGSKEAVWLLPEDAAGWHSNSALPGGGSNVVISGHHNIGTEVFKDLVNLKQGDEITLQADGRDYKYEVTDSFIIPDRDVPAEQRQQNGQWIMPTEQERLTLVTCWPRNDNSHRLVVLAQPKF
jgi:LPXTG-site transpeptidase (sortase) family protein